MTPVRIATSPFVNGVGRAAWENMVRRTRNPFWRESSKPDVPEPKPGAVKKLFDRFCGEDRDNGNQRITLIGHSMGSMMISDILRTYPDCHYRNIVFMAAAVSIREFGQTRGARAWIL